MITGYDPKFMQCISSKRQSAGNSCQLQQVDSGLKEASPKDMQTCMCVCYINMQTHIVRRKYIFCQVIAMIMLLERNKPMGRVSGHYWPF